MERNRGALRMLIFSVFIFGTIGVVRRYLPLPSEVLAFSRGMMGGLFLLLLQRARHQPFSWKSLSRGSFGLLCLTGAFIGFNWILLFEAYNYTTVAVATLCYYMQPVIVILLSSPLLGEKITGRQLLCVGFSLVGMVLVSGILGSDQPGTHHMLGVLMGLGAALLYSGVVLLNKRIHGVPVYEKTIIQLFSAAVVMLPYMLFTGTLKTYPLTGSQVLLFLMAGILHTGIAYAVYFRAIEELPAKTCALFSYIDPVSAILLSALFLREPMDGFGIIGTVLIIGSAIVSEL